MARKPMATLPDVFAKPGAAPARGTPIEALPQDDGVTPDPTDVSALTGGSGSEGAPVSDGTPSITDVPSAAASAPGPSLPAVPGVDEPGVTPAPVATRPSGQDAETPSGHEPATALAVTMVESPLAPSVVPPAAGSAQSVATGDRNAAAGSKDMPAAPAAATRASAEPPATPIDDPKPAMIPPPKPVETSAPRPVAAPPASTPPPEQDRVRAAVPTQDAAPSSPPERGAAWGIAIAALAVSLTTPFWYDGALRLLGIVPSLHRAQLEDALTLSRQERKLRDVEQRLSTASTQLARTQADLAQANRVQQEATAWTRLVVAARLAEAVKSGRPFVSEWAVAQASNVLGGDVAATTAVIAPYAPIGVPSMDDLARDFRRLTDPVLRPARGLNPLAWASAALSYLPFGRTAPDPNPGLAALREAAALVEVRRIFEAAALLRPLTGPVREGMVGWLADVDARAAAEALDRRVSAAMRPGRS